MLDCYLCYLIHYPKQMPKHNWFKKLSVYLGVTGVSLLAGLPVLARFYYPPSSFFQPIANYYQSGEPCFENLDDKQNLVYNLKNGCFEGLVEHLEKTSLPTTLAGQETFTILAPDDEAFGALTQDVREKLSQPENLEKVLKYHVIAGVISDEDIKRGEVKTVEGNTIKIAGSIENNQERAKLNEATVGYGIKTSNGYIISIDKVLLPPDF